VLDTCWVMDFSKSHRRLDYFDSTQYKFARNGERSRTITLFLELSIILLEIPFSSAQFHKKPAKSWILGARKKCCLGRANG
jgi:hypothetical protein